MLGLHKHVCEVQLVLRHPLYFASVRLNSASVRLRVTVSFEVSWTLKNLDPFARFDERRNLLPVSLSEEK